MDIDRRRLLVTAVAATVPGTALFAAPTAALLLPARGVDATQFGVRAGVTDDQSAALQRAIDQTTNARVPLLLGPGIYHGGDLKLPAGAQLIGVRNATRLVFRQGPSLISASHADGVTLSDLVLDGAGISLPDGRGLIHLESGHDVRIADCEVIRAGGHGIMLDTIAGQVTGTTVTDSADTAIFSLNAHGLLLSGNTIRTAGNGGIRVWQSEKHDDGTLVVDNRIEDIAARSGGSGQNGNAINVFRAANVLVRGNQIRKAAFSAIRGNAASNIQIIGNSCSDLGEVAIYSEFDFEGAVIAHNTVDGATVGVSVTNFNKGGRLAVVQGNVLRNFGSKNPASTDVDDIAGIGISVEADTAVTGNVIENASTAGIVLGWGQYLRDVTVTGNIVRTVGYGITVSVTKGAGAAVIADNLISGARRGAIVGVEWKKAVTGDLTKDGVGTYSQLTIHDNRVQ
jgi:uncharacterized secreted repeat protein (TIGR03808 family)